VRLPFAAPHGVLAVRTNRDPVVAAPSAEIGAAAGKILRPSTHDQITW
jgi:hypothetical protein